MNKDLSSTGFTGIVVHWFTIILKLQQIAIAHNLLCNPSASSKFFLNVFKIFWSCSIFLNMVKYFWPCSNIQNYKVKYHFWPCSKIFDQVQKILNKVKKVWTRSKYFWTSRWNRHNFSATYPDSVRKKFCWVIFIENTYLSMGPRGRVTSMAHFFLIYSKRFDKSQLNFWLRAYPFWQSRIIKTILKIFTPNSLQRVVV